MNHHIQLHPNDDVVIARHQLMSGDWIDQIKVKGLIPAGHKIALRALSVGDPVRRYNQIIGFASQSIAPGEHVHVHNLGLGDNKGDFARDYAFCADVKPSPALQHAQFMGYKRDDGRVATRNYIGILSSVNCSATVARAIADHFSRTLHPEALAAFDNVDGVVALTHGTGCGMDTQGLGMQVLERTMAGYATHPNFAAVLAIGLGCEANQLKSWLNHSGLQEGRTLQTFNIQDSGGTAKTVAKGIAMVKDMLPLVNQSRRTECSASHLMVGLQCGGSDGYSGISANPALGAAVDLLVQHGGAAILSETPEIYGVEHTLTRRAASKEIGEKLIKRIRWWKDEYSVGRDVQINGQVSPGNQIGGLANIFEKSLGSSMKGGTGPLMEVYKYAEPVTAKGFVFMDTPGFDPVSATGQIAGGANLIAFTTGRGSMFGSKPAPCIKLATNTPMYQRLTEDMDINCGEILDGTVSVQEMGQRIFELFLKTASGEPSKSELLGLGDYEFVPWQIGVMS